MTAPAGMPDEAVHELPKPTERFTPVPCGLHRKRVPSADAATVPPLVTPPGSLPWNQLLPPSVENATRLTFAFSGIVRSTLPERIIQFGLVSAKSMLVPLVKLGWVNISDGTASRL